MRRDGEVDKIWPSQTAFLDTNPLLRLGESLIDTAAIYMDFCVRVLFLTTSALHNSVVIALHPFEFAAVASMYGLFNHCIQLVPMRVEIAPIQLRKIELSFHNTQVVDVREAVFFIVMKQTPHASEFTLCISVGPYHWILNDFAKDTRMHDNARIKCPFRLDIVSVDDPLSKKRHRHSDGGVTERSDGVTKCDALDTDTDSDTDSETEQNRQRRGRARECGRQSRGWFG